MTRNPLDLSRAEVKELTRRTPDLDRAERCPHATVKIIARDHCTQCLGISVRRAPTFGDCSIDSIENLALVVEANRKRRVMPIGAPRPARRDDEDVS